MASKSHTADAFVCLFDFVAAMHLRNVKERGVRDATLHTSWFEWLRVPTCHNRPWTPCFHAKVDLRPVGTPEPVRRDLGTAGIGIQDARRRVQRHHALGQVGAHIKGIEEPDKADHAEADGDVNEEFANVHFLLLLLAVKRRGLLIFS